jgi:hypothetical protein
VDIVATLHAILAIVAMYQCADRNPKYIVLANEKRKVSFARTEMILIR